MQTTETIQLKQKSIIRQSNAEEKSLKQSYNSHIYLSFPKKGHWNAISVIGKNITNGHRHYVSFRYILFY